MFKYGKLHYLLAAAQAAREREEKENIPKKRFTVFKLPRGLKPPRAAARDGSIAHGDAALSVGLGVRHIKGCHGCDLALCNSARRLVRRCANHVRHCKRLNSQDCQACNVSSMVKTALQSEISDDTGEQSIVE